MRFGNCFFWAWLEWHKRVYAWRRAGGRQGWEPVLCVRPSRSNPWWIPHFLVSREVSGGIPGMEEAESFKPLHPSDVPWWKAWTHFLFVGAVRRGDFPDTLPIH